MKKKFLLRIDENLYAALEKWAADDFRSINGQIEFLLLDLVKKAGRYPKKVKPENSAEIKEENSGDIQV